VKECSVYFPRERFRAGGSFISPKQCANVIDDSHQRRLSFVNLRVCSRFAIFLSSLYHIFAIPSSHRRNLLRSLYHIFAIPVLMEKKFCVPLIVLLQYPVPTEKTFCVPLTIFLQSTVHIKKTFCVPLTSFLQSAIPCGNSLCVPFFCNAQFPMRKIFCVPPSSKFSCPAGFKPAGHPDRFIQGCCQSHQGNTGMVSSNLRPSRFPSSLYAIVSWPLKDIQRP